MALFEAVVWALIFQTKLRFPLGVSIGIVLKNFSYVRVKNREGKIYGVHLTNLFIFEEVF